MKNINYWSLKENRKQTFLKLMSKYIGQAEKLREVCQDQKAPIPTLLSFFAVTLGCLIQARDVY